ncbi:Magnesium protoporphyrin IX methyltransferase, chloroplastic [Linum perenne]
MARASSLFSPVSFNLGASSSFSPLCTKSRVSIRTLTVAAIPPISTATPVELPPLDGGGDKEVVKEYFNNSGFQRWRKIYGETDDVNRVQRDIRLGHSKTVEKTMVMLQEEGSLRGVTVCDAGCGTGLLSIPLAKEGAIVYSSDISAAMVAEAEKQVGPSNSLNVVMLKS